MNRLASILLVLTLASLAGCGGKPAEESPSSSTPAPSTPATSEVLAKSLYDDGPRAGETPVDAAAAAVGEKLFSTKGCTACHAWGKRLTGPDLKDVTKRRTQAWMEQQILHPDVMIKTDPISREMFGQFALQMPKQGLTEAEAKQVIEYLKKRDKDGK
jgi:cytochrome c